MIMRLFSEFFAMQERGMFRRCFSLKSSSKNDQKTAMGEDGHSSQLQLCNLPDEILIRILSLLPTTQDAVQTCLILFRKSERKHLWKSLTRLKFRSYDVPFILRESHITKFLERVMDLRDPSAPLVSFSLHYFLEKEDDAIRIKTFITKAVQSNVEELSLSLFNAYSCSRGTCLPFCTFGCHSLVKLDLQFISFDVPSSVICLPRLKYLRLFQSILINAEPIEMLLSSPLLEELIIDNCSWNRIVSVRVSFPKLQVLKIWDGDGSYHAAKVCIIGDNLKYFSYTGNLNKTNWICASSSTQLTKVEIYVDQQKFGDFCRVNFYDILKGFYGTRNLALSDYFLEGLQNISELLDTVQVFECLTRLDIQVYKKEMSIDSLALMKIYERCPHLEYLNIGKLSNTTMRNLQLSPIPLCFQTSLKKILVHYYVPGDNRADVAIDVLLNSALVLEELVIFCLRDEANGFHEGGCKIQELQDSFNRRPRVSKECIISVRVTYCIKNSPSWSYYNECYVKSMSEF